MKTLSSSEVYQIKITLTGTQPRIWRRLRVPATLTLAQFHDVLQTAIGWKNCHLHEFRIGGRAYGASDPNEGMHINAIDERTVRLLDVLGAGQTKGNYLYDFGDSWEHELTLEKILPADVDLPTVACVDGEQQAPPEDSGGVGGFYDFLAAIQDRRHPQHKEMLKWVGRSFDPEAFSVDDVNRTLNALRWEPKEPNHT
jgi:hypothetical protein